MLVHCSKAGLHAREHLLFVQTGGLKTAPQRCIFNRWRVALSFSFCVNFAIIFHRYIVRGLVFKLLGKPTHLYLSSPDFWSVGIYRRVWAVLSSLDPTETSYLFPIFLFLNLVIVIFASDFVQLIDLSRICERNHRSMLANCALAV